MGDHNSLEQDRILEDLREKGRLFRERGGTTVFSIREEARDGTGTILIYEAKYEPWEHGPDGVLIPQEPTKGRLIGFEKATSTIGQPPAVAPQPHDLPVPGHHHPAQG